MHDDHKSGNEKEYVTYKICWEPNGVVKYFSGHVTDSDLMKANSAVDGDSRFDSLRFEIYDFLFCANFSITSQVIDELVAISSAAVRTNDHIKIAFVVSAQELIDIANLYANSPHNAYSTRIFHTQEAARNWIN